jgi:hypothetical protein
MTLAKRKRVKNETPYPANWAVSTEYQAGRKLLTRDPPTTFAVSGEPGGRFRFTRHVRNTDTGEEWIDCIGGTDQGAVIMFRSFRPYRVTRILK